MSAALIIFIRNPQLGKVKTRLAATMGDELALRIYTALLERIRQVTEPLPVSKYLFYSDFIEENDEWLPAHFTKKLQHNGDPEKSGQALGERMSKAFDEILRQHQRAVIVGSDVPGITPAILHDAFEKLATHDFTIGGTDDGGYYLLGMNAHEPAVFQGIEWSTAAVFSQTMEVIGRLGKTCHQLPVLPDIDYEEDWKKHGWKI
ncbi:MAG: TIGR04282 family arsenosugar biosynthesis glycosyltransferase [Saprospiraceae bacterium]|nr:TIGR04282 family arsenosugar biosynthesis glycosyltransferase [Saprospiraceae bacterium]MCF8248701.1 TIGR04282 family arsenosugar biosynthesis glycosyltransferase [Saprospiraceae bacterium]MCF8278809.1 TIGR04282 family arsenosugar biosynthesis glycosyltransferase [Bacteroidales bacterium]MCF8310609.1 TIGR04282 family arsenosugar biosynthesis glycosyltransferase [Saprospiraceae bacterium]MCF8439168.1 TIGR04282 family arsenosugar biosynthesis glycosyltransferase [Saprospiraceae bacterium]